MQNERMSEYEFVGYEKDGPVVTITFDRPERMNVFGPRRRNTFAA